MASEEDLTSDGLDVIVKDVPEHLQGFVKTKVAEYITKSKDVSMEIHESQGHAPRLVVTFEPTPESTGDCKYKIDGIGSNAYRCTFAPIIVRFFGLRFSI